jgi:hypothetical protein
LTGLSVDEREKTSSHSNKTAITSGENRGPLALIKLSLVDDRNNDTLLEGNVNCAGGGHEIFIGF